MTSLICIFWKKSSLRHPPTHYLSGSVFIFLVCQVDFENTSRQFDAYLIILKTRSIYYTVVTSSIVTSYFRSLQNTRIILYFYLSKFYNDILVSLGVITVGSSSKFKNKRFAQNKSPSYIYIISVTKPQGLWSSASVLLFRLLLKKNQLQNVSFKISFFSIALNRERVKIRFKTRSRSRSQV